MATSCIKGMVLKTNNTERLGISFISDTKGDVFISRVKGKFRRSTHLVAGLKVLGVNDKQVYSALEAANVIRNAPCGKKICIEAHGEYLKVSKKKGSSYGKNGSFYGITFEKVSDFLQIASIDKNGSFSSSSLRKGHIVLSLNGKSVSSVRMANLLLKLNKTISLVAVPPIMEEEEEDVIIDLENEEEAAEGYKSTVIQHQTRILVETSDQQERYEDTNPRDFSPSSKSLLDALIDEEEEKQLEESEDEESKEEEDEEAVINEPIHHNTITIRSTNEEKTEVDESSLQEDDHLVGELSKKDSHSFLQPWFQLFDVACSKVGRRQQEEDPYVI